MNKFKEERDKLVSAEGFRAMRIKAAADELANREENERKARLQASRVRIAAADAAKKSF